MKVKGTGFTLLAYGLTLIWFTLPEYPINVIFGSIFAFIAIWFTFCWINWNRNGWDRKRMMEGRK
jgi:thiol:disulfide interchange protein